ncbi:TolC family protein [Emticicia sp. W12TSBA100-4]|uniref:TolC family protein n=2 Tax=unclassified Emticicia TaxID=2627301 RepID=UPI00330621D3
MSKNRSFIFSILIFFSEYGYGQTLSLKAIIDSVEKNHPVVEMYKNEIRSMDEAALGAKSWMPPTAGIGQFMTPYNVNLWKRNGDMLGMGSVMLSAEQMFPNKKKLNADEAYMKAMSSVEKEKKNADLNELVQQAKQYYYDWIILQKRLIVSKANQELLEFMIKNAELRYKNGLEKISAYYKAKAALGYSQNMQLMYESEIRDRRIKLNALMNKNSFSYFQIDTSIVWNDYSSFSFDSTLFYNNRSDLKAIDKQTNLNTLKIETEKASLKPQFGVKYDNAIGFGGQPLQYSIMAMVKLPMVSWASKMNKANIQSIIWKNNALQSQKQMMAVEYMGMANSMRNEFQLKQKQLKLYDENIIPALKNNYKTMQLAYEQNTEELFMLFDAWEKLNMTQLEYFDILNKALEMQVSLDKLIEKK